MRIYKNNKGITLIALVVSIIVLLILAGISISMLTGQNG
ncbi:MAG: prepilin-type N-terminal cleavage/methylation domain-containing protein [Clostridia bacterium]